MAPSTSKTMSSKDRIAGAALSLFALWVIWESRTLPLGTVRVPGPAFMPVLLALLLLVFGLFIAATGARAAKFASLKWKELPHAAAILAVCALSAWTLERLGYRLTVVLAISILVKAVEKKGWVATALDRKSVV